mgnify:CR=1 FL=1
MKETLSSSRIIRGEHHDAVAGIHQLRGGSAAADSHFGAPVLRGYTAFGGSSLPFAGELAELPEGEIDFADACGPGHDLPVQGSCRFQRSRPFPR